MALFSSFVLMLAAVSFAANSSNSKASANKAATVMSTKSPAKSMHDALASAEDLSGTISFIAPSDNEVTLIGVNGTPFDFRVTTTTTIDLAGRRISETELANENHKQATVRFLPTAEGNIAESLEISG